MASTAASGNTPRRRTQPCSWNAARTASSVGGAISAPAFPVPEAAMIQSIDSSRNRLRNPPVAMFVFLSGAAGTGVVAPDLDPRPSLPRMRGRDRVGALVGGALERAPVGG